MISIDAGATRAPHGYMEASEWKLWLVRAGRFLTARECLALQGIWASDFPALDAWARHPKKLKLLHDLAGNAFSTPVCMTVCLAVIMTAI